jgi:hypothetical protein
MAELHIEKKQKSNTMWIVIGVVVVALIAWLALRTSDDGTLRPGTTSGTTTGMLPVANERALASLVPSDRHDLITIG